MAQSKVSMEHMKALTTWAEQHGRTWKAALREAWMTGDYEGFEESNLLQQLRNNFGPSWLIRVKL